MLLTLALAAGVVPASARGDTFTVTTDADTGTGSLRDAVTQANANSVADTIDFLLPAGQRTSG